MSTCPNKNTQHYKDLVKQLGSEEAAIFTWKMYKGNFPEEMDLDVLKSKMGIKDSMSFLQKLILFKINLSLKDLYMLTTFIIIPPQR